jgi:ABC-type glycerol-3-phosphate transport system substrate-binding protein
MNATADDRRSPTIARRTFLIGSGALAGVGLLPSCSRLSGRSSGGKNTVKWAQFYTRQAGAAAEGNKRWLQAVIAQFKKENAGWSVELEGYDYDKIDQRLILDMRAGVHHDVSLTTPQLMAQHAQAGSLLDLSTDLRTWGSDQVKDFDWSPVWQSCVVDNKQLGIPLGNDTRLLTYSEPLLRKAGLDPAESFGSLDGLLSAAQKLTTHDTWGLGMMLGSDRSTTELSFAPLAWSFGGDIYDLTNRQATLTGDGAVQAAQWIYDAVHIKKVVAPFTYAPTATNDDILLNDFTTGKIACSFSFGNYWNQALQTANMVNGCFPPSAGCASSSAGVALLPTKGHAAFTNAWNISIASNTTNAAMAWKLIEVILRPELLRQYSDAGLPARLSEYAKPAYRTPFYQTWEDAAKDGRSMPATAHYQELSDACAAALQEMLGGRRSDILSVLRRSERDWNSKYAGT